MGHALHGVTDERTPGGIGGRDSQPEEREEGLEHDKRGDPEGGEHHDYPEGVRNEMLENDP